MWKCHRVTIEISVHIAMAVIDWVLINVFNNYLYDIYFVSTTSTILLSQQTYVVGTLHYPSIDILNLPLIDDTLILSNHPLYKWGI